MGGHPAYRKKVSRGSRACRRKCGQPGEDGTCLLQAGGLGKAQDSGEPPRTSARNSLCVNARMVFCWCLLSDVEFLADAEVPVLSKGPRLVDEPLFCPLDVNSLWPETKSQRPWNYSPGRPVKEGHQWVKANLRGYLGNIATKEIRVWITLASE